MSRLSMPKTLHYVLGVAVALTLCGVAHADTRLIVRLRADTAKSGMTTKARIAKAGADSGLALSHVRPMAVGFDVVVPIREQGIAGDMDHSRRDRRRTYLSLLSGCGRKEIGRRAIG